jgi:hypothetical protein
MEDCHLYSLACCHTHSAQILEFPQTGCPLRLYRALGDGDGLAGADFRLPAPIHSPLAETVFRPVSTLRQRNDSQKIPTSQYEIK